MPYDKDIQLSSLRQLGKLQRLSKAIFIGASSISLGFLSKQLKIEEVLTSYLTDLEVMVDDCELSWVEFFPLIMEYVTNTSKGFSDEFRSTDKADTDLSTKVEDELSRLIQNAYKLISDKLESLPKSIEKAQVALEFILEESLSGNAKYIPNPDILIVLEDSNPKLVQTHIQRYKDFLLNDGLPDSYTSHFWWEAVGWIKFFEKHNSPHYKKKIDLVCDELVEELERINSDLWINNGHPESICVKLDAALHICWICSFSYKVRSKIEHIVSQVLNVAITYQSQNGGFLGGNAKICSRTTSLAVGCLQRYRIINQWNEEISIGIDWLLTNTNESGGWGQRDNVYSDHIMPTIAALDAMRIQGIPLEHKSIIDAENSLFQDLQITGAWAGHKGECEDLFSSLVLSYFQRRQQRETKMNGATQLGRGFILKAQALQTHHYPTDKILALISLYHGLEYILYGFLLECGKEIREKSGRTIGLDSALYEFKNIAQLSSWIDAGAGLPFSTQISELKSRRDEVIHRMGGISDNEIERFISQVCGFIEHFDFKVLGYKLLE